MPADYDATEFVDGDLQGRRSPHQSVVANNGRQGRAPSREEVDSRVVDAQNKLSELRRAQEELERERSSLEETRRRQLELQTGRQEIIQNLTRGVGLLQEAEFVARRDAEQMAKTLVGLREALSKVEAVQEDSWTQDNFASELTRALTTLENARMEWNAARLKFDVLNGAAAADDSARKSHSSDGWFAPENFRQRCQLGLALTWPLVVLGLAIFLTLLLRR